MKARDISPFGVRIPEKLKERLKESAKKNGRSLNAEILHRLIRSYHLEQNPRLLLEQAQPGSLIETIDKDLKARIEETLPDLIQKLAKNYMNEEYKSQIRELAIEKARKDFEEKFPEVDE